jgi:hypothetical protein
MSDLQQEMEAFFAEYTELECSPNFGPKLC